MSAEHLPSEEVHTPPPECCWPYCGCVPQCKYERDNETQKATQP